MQRSLSLYGVVLQYTVLYFLLEIYRVLLVRVHGTLSISDGARGTILGSCGVLYSNFVPNRPIIQVPRAEYDSISFQGSASVQKPAHSEENLSRDRFETRRVNACAESVIVVPS